MIKSKILPYVLLPLAASGMDTSKVCASTTPSEIVASADSLEGVVADVEMLNELVGRPAEGNVLSKVNDLFFRNNWALDVTITRDALKAYFDQSSNEKVSETARDLLKNFEGVHISSSLGGGVDVDMNGDSKFLVHTEKFTLECEVSEDYKSTIIDKFHFDGVTSYVFRIDSGYTKLDVKKWYLGVLDFFGVDRASIPELERAEYTISLGGVRHAIFEVKNGKLKQIGDVFDNKNNKYEVGDLKSSYRKAFDLGVSSIEKDLK